VWQHVCEVGRLQLPADDGGVTDGGVCVARAHAGKRPCGTLQTTASTHSPTNQDAHANHNHDTPPMSDDGSQPQASCRDWTPQATARSASTFAALPSTICRMPS
jgi:hypothetical protein